MELPGGLATSSATVFLFYPYRDYVKYYPTAVDGNFFVSRWRGLALNPAQVGLLALPNAFMLGISGRGEVQNLVLASVAAGMMRRFLRTLIYRMGERGGGKAGRAVYGTNLDAITKATAAYGPLSWFIGGSAASLVQLMTSGLAIRSVGGTQPGRRNRRHDGTTAFFMDWWYMFRAHMFFTLVTAPLRNALSGPMHNPTRGSDYISPAAWARSEAHIYKEAALISKRMFQDMGLRYFFQGTIRSVMKVSLPFGFNYALYRAAMGTLEPQSKGRGW